MLTSVQIKDFKSYKSATLRLAPLTVLIGANASGKSNAIEALRLLSWVAQGNRLSAIRYAVYEGDGAVRGTTSTLARRGASKFTLGANISDPAWSQYSISLSRTSDDELHISDERVTGAASSVPLYEVVSSSPGAGSDLRVAYNNFARGGRKPQVTCNDQMAILLQMQSAARFEAGHKVAQNSIPRVCEMFQEQLGGMLFLDPQPSAMRDYSFKSEVRLKGNGANLSGVLFNLCKTESGKEKVLNLIKSLPEQDISDIEFIETPRGEVMVSLSETFGDSREKFDATLLSDGTLRVLSIAAAILSAPEGSLVVVEEIDNGVHPSRAAMLLNSVSAIAKSRKLSVLISSHNPAMLDALPDDAVPNVVFCYRDNIKGGSQLVRLSDIPDYPQLIAQGSVGHLMTNGLMDRFVKYHPGPARRREVAQRWIEQLRAGK
ncbi:MAG: ATPase [Caulobacter vibrioides]|uniref:ATPase n=1 Tax=Caulobacter vibrioides TaxID=155892 RepID=A0A258D4D1_CAUVI|nr:MAG: ATPase [Caulobacter vibrioides]